MSARLPTVTSRDGTVIAYERSGDGPPLVLVHGSISDHAYWWAVLPALAARFTVHAMDRRGRGQSGDASAYALDREAEDVAALVDAIPAPVALLGHSYGALCALEAARLEAVETGPEVFAAAVLECLAQRPETT